MNKPTLQEIATALGRQMTTPLMPNVVPEYPNLSPEPAFKVEPPAKNRALRVDAYMQVSELDLVALVNAISQAGRLDELQAEIDKVRAEQTKE
jgi:hypothetical protein